MIAYAAALPVVDSARACDRKAINLVVEGGNSENVFMLMGAS